MSGGVAYVLDPDDTFASRCNTSMCSLESLADQAEIAELRALIERHVSYTDSERGRQVLTLWDEMVPKFVKVLPNDYKRMLTAIERVKNQGLSDDEAVMAAFEENARDVARVAGN